VRGNIRLGTGASWVPFWQLRSWLRMGFESIPYNHFKSMSKAEVDKTVYNFRTLVWNYLLKHPIYRNIKRGFQNKENLYILNTRNDRLQPGSDVTRGGRRRRSRHPPNFNFLLETFCCVEVFLAFARQIEKAPPPPIFFWLRSCSVKSSTKGS